MSCSPFSLFRDQCLALLRESLSAEGLSEAIGEIRLVEPSDKALGDLSFSTFTIAKAAGADPRAIAERLAARADGPLQGPAKGGLVGKVLSAGAGYVNFYINVPEFGRATLEAVVRGGEGYGRTPGQEGGERVIVEHTSVNPIHPIHIGGARNAIIGDCLARILKASGADVMRHFYIDDVGLQVAQASLGFSKAGGIRQDLKIDHFVGFVYAVTSCAINLKSLKREVERLKAEGKDQEAVDKIREVDDWVAAAADLRSRDEKTFDAVFGAVSGLEDPEGEIARLLQRYEAREEEAVGLIRGLCERTISGFRETLKRAGVFFDSWDWESEVASWNGGAKEAVERLEATEFVRVEEGTMLLDCEAVIEKFGLREKYAIRTEVPPLILRRSDGTTLYTTRDIAYTLWKFGRAERIINVISIEQKLPQLQLKLALHALGRPDLAERLVHFSYELVHLPGYKMSGRRGRYVAFDDVLDEAVARAYQEVSSKSPHLSEAERQRIAELVGIGAVRYAMVSVASHKPLTFTWDRVLNFERNSAPFIQYAHARSCNILAKAGESWRGTQAEYSALSSAYEKALIVSLSTFPERVSDAAKSLKPEDVAAYANDLASTFNLFYDNVPVLKTEDARAKAARLALVDATRIVLANALAMLGIEAPSRM